MAANGPEPDPALLELLDDALNDFQPPPTKSHDDDLDEFMQKVDKEATRKAAENFQAMLEGIVRRKEEEKDGTKEDEEERELAKSISKMIFSGEEKDGRELEKELDRLSMSRGGVEELMDTIVRTAVSRQAMYPPIKDLHCKFGPFLEEKGAQLDADTLHRYREQYRILGLLRNVYDDESSGSNAEEVEQTRASKIAQLWLEMQKYGLPPPELSNSLHQGMAADQFGSEDDEHLNGCSIM